MRSCRRGDPADARSSGSLITLRRRRGFVTLGLAALAVSAPTPVAANCPPYKIQNTPFWFFGREFQRTLSPAEREAWLKGGVVQGFPVAVIPPRGPAPLTVGVAWVLRPEDPQVIEFDAEGDGAPEVSSTRDEDFGHTYQNPGRFQAIIRVRSRQGQVTVYTIPVTVLTQVAFDAEMQGRFASLKAALRRGDLRAGLECLHSESKRRYEDRLKSLSPREVERAFPPVRFVKQHAAEALYEALRPASPADPPFQFRFLLDWDSVWRLRDLWEVTR